MARLIVKSPYIQCGKQNAGSYLRYIATRERVEIIPDDRPPTRKQEQLITKLAKDFPDVKELLEYEDYVQKPTKANASSMITLALEEHWKQVQQTDGYMKYIATRPRAERLGDHGLFGDVDHVDLDAAMSELEHYTGNVWTHIISLHREDAERLGYNNAQAWRALLRARRNDIAAAMHILPQDFRWYAAFHDEDHHPHVHMMAWSVKPGQAHLDRDGIRQMKSQLTNDIFQQELLHVYEQKSVSRDELFYPQLGVKLCSMAGGGVQKIYMMFLREPSQRDRSGSDLFHLRDGFEIEVDFDGNVSCLIAVDVFVDNDFFNQAV